MSDKRTTKVVTGTFRMVFHGDYVALDEIPGRIDAWTDAGLEDRDNLRTWRFEVTEITEVDGDPEGYDS